jgi:aryl-alcohol dehydrogenase-like predicted oxidoreductase
LDSSSVQWMDGEAKRPPHVFGVGTWQNFRADTDTRILEKLIETAVDAGIRYFDTADSYDNGTAEIILGKILSNIPRNKFSVGTKCFHPTSEHPIGGLRRSRVRDALERSLDRLGLHRLDVYFAHRYDPDVRIEAVAETFHELIIENKISSWGLCRWPLGAAMNLLNYSSQQGLTSPIVQQFHYNLFNRTAEEESFPLFYNNGLHTMVYSPLAQGVLTGKYGNGVEAGSRADRIEGRQTLWDLDQSKIARVENWRRIWASRGYSPVQMALAFCLRRREVSSVLLGARTSEQLEECVRSLTISWEEMDEEALKL